jgi:hypothetical protein
MWCSYAVMLPWAVVQLLPHGAAACDWTRGWREEKGGERESGQLHGFHSLTTDGSVLSKLLFTFFLYKQFDYSSLKCYSIKEFSQLILTKRSTKFILYIGQHGKVNCSKLSIRRHFFGLANWDFSDWLLIFKALETTEHWFVGISSVPTVYGCTIDMEEGARRKTAWSYQETRGEGETSLLSLINLKHSG